MIEALGMIETRGLAISYEVADVMLRHANVRLVHQDRVNIALITVFISGDVSSVQAAVRAGLEVAKRRNALVSSHLIAHVDKEVHPLVTTWLPR